MAFTGIDSVVRALKSARDIMISKSSISSQILANYASSWRATGYPAQGAIPAAAAICTDATLGALPLPGRAGAQERAILWDSIFSTIGNTLAVFDRLGHMGGLNGTLTTAQTVALDVSGTSDNLVARRGQTDYSQVRWFLEWYTATGATVVNATVNVTYSDLSTGNITVALITNMAAGRMFEIVPTNGLYIRAVNSVTLSATTGTAGSFGVTAAVEKVTHIHQAVFAVPYDYAQLGLPLIEDQSCLFFAQLMSGNANGGGLFGRMKIGVD